MDWCNGCANPTTHVVVCGDTVWKIAQAYNSTPNCIYQQNPEIQFDNLLIGTVLKICRNSQSGGGSGGCGCGCSSGCGCGGCGGCGCNSGCGC